MKHTKIQWCDDSANPVMGCDGCELWLGPEKIITELMKLIIITCCLPPDKDIRMGQLVNAEI
ncbi:MAG: hypothetical protein WCS42_25450 [Verrucomicrobiota bacterium]